MVGGAVAHRKGDGQVNMIRSGAFNKWHVPEGAPWIARTLKVARTSKPQLSWNIKTKCGITLGGHTSAPRSLIRSAGGNQTRCSKCEGRK